MHDLVISQARLVDGTGRPWRRASVAIDGSRVVDIGHDVGTARRTIDAADRVLAPGFIDMHAHSDLAVLAKPGHEMKVAQGVTTEVVAQDGLTCAPVREEAKPRVAQLVGGLLGTLAEWRWNSVREYLDVIDGTTTVNVAMLAGHATIRCDLLRGEDRPASEAELSQLEAVVEQAMRDGAFGLSTGLEYEPTTTADTAEIIRLAAAAARYGGFYVTHLRDYDERFLEAHAEAETICREAQSALHYSHYHCYGRKNFGLAPGMCRRAERARKRGLDVSFDIYPYTAGTTYAHWFISRDPQVRTIPYLRKALPDPRLRNEILVGLEREGMPVDIGWEDCFPGAHGETIDAQGFSLAAIAERDGTSPAEALLRLAERSDFQATLNGVMNDAEDVDGTIHHPLATVGSDAILHGAGLHPRGWGSFAKVIRLYVVERATMTIEQAVALMSGRPAARLGLADRGIVAPGAIADIVLFDPESVRDHADYSNPTRLATGVDLVMVAGRAVWEEGRLTGDTPGRGLRSAASRAAAPLTE